MLIVVSFIAMAGLVKGAQMPFDGWLLGAMVAPSPVSAILHSATMVKLAPFIILKLAPAYENTIVGQFIMVFGAFVFVVAGLYGFSRDKFKEILGYSTISLLGLMISMATFVGDEHKHILYILIFFHALSKALLFLLAGILEKNHHLKNVSDMDGLLHKAPLSASMIIIGFATITLPPFGSQHIALLEPVRFQFEAQDEKIIDVKADIGFVHRGIEKACTSTFEYKQVASVAARVCGLCAITHSLTYVMAVEQLVDVHVSDKAKYLSMLMFQLFSLTLIHV